MLIALLLAALQAATPPAPNQRTYIVGTNDVLMITVYNQAQLSGKFSVEADGTIAYPLLGRVAAGGLTVRAVEEKIHDGLANGYLKDPQVSVSVDQYPQPADLRHGRGPAAWDLPVHRRDDAGRSAGSRGGDHGACGERC